MNGKSPTHVDPSKKTVVVIGAGLIGTLSTYFLARSGRYQVICVESGDAPACATSKANAGRFCPSLLGDFAPKIEALRTVFRPSTSNGEGGVGRVSWSPAVVSWGLKYVYAATFRRDEINSSLERMGQLSNRLTKYLLKDILYLKTITPNVWVYADSTSMRNGQAVLNKSKIAQHRQLGSEQCSSMTSIANKVFGVNGGCISIESDFTADARDFTQKVADASAKLNAVFKFNSRVEKVIRDGDKLCAVELNDGSRIPCDYVVVACGPWSNRIFQKWFGMSLPIMPLRGASVQLLNVKNNIPVGFSDNSSGDIHFQATPFGDSLRLAGFADVVDSPDAKSVIVECSSRYKDALLARVKVVLPNVSWEGESPLWCGLRPVTPDRLPLIGPTNQQGVFLNTGHGAIGWTLAAASGYLLCASMLRHDGFSPLGLDQDGDNIDVQKQFSLNRFWGLS